MPDIAQKRTGTEAGATDRNWFAGKFLGANVETKVIMSNELIAILLVGSLLGIAELLTYAWSLQVLREIQRTHRAIAGLIVQESEKVQQLLRV